MDPRDSTWLSYTLPRLYFTLLHSTMALLGCTWLYYMQPWLYLTLLHTPMTLLHSTIALHCKNKLVVLTTEWLPWLQTSWRDSGYERFALIWKSNCIRQPKMQQPSSSYNHNTLTTFRTSVNESQQMHFKVVATTFHALNASRWFPHRCSEGCQCIVVVC